MALDAALVAATDWVTWRESNARLTTVPVAEGYCESLDRCLSLYEGLTEDREYVLAVGNGATEAAVVGVTVTGGRCGCAGGVCSSCGHSNDAAP